MEGGNMRDGERERRDEVRKREEVGRQVGR